MNIANDNNNSGNNCNNNSNNNDNNNAILTLITAKSAITAKIIMIIIQI